MIHSTLTRSIHDNNNDFTGHLSDGFKGDHKHSYHSTKDEIDFDRLASIQTSMRPSLSTSSPAIRLQEKNISYSSSSSSSFSSLSSSSSSSSSSSLSSSSSSFSSFSSSSLSPTLPRDFFVKHLFTKNHEKVKHLVEKRNAKGQTPIHLAAYLGRSDAINLLHKAGANLEAADSDGRTAIHYAVIGGQQDSIKLDTIKCLARLGAKLEKAENNIFRKRPEDHCYGPLKTDLLEIIKIQSIVKSTLTSNPTLMPPQNLVFQGGGPKGIAYIGVLKELQKQKALDAVTRVAGTSAGAITATLLATGHTLPEIESILTDTNLTHFLDGPLVDPVQQIKEGYQKGVTGITVAEIIIKNRKKLSDHSLFLTPRNFVMDLRNKFLALEGVCPGETFRQWIEERIREKTGIAHCTFKELRTLIEEGKPFKHLYVFGTKLGPPAEVVCFSTEDPKCDNYIISDTIRISMSIPGAFEPHYIHEKREGVRHRLGLGRYIDGGLLKNFPIDCFDFTKYKNNAVPEEQANEKWTNNRTWGISLYDPPDNEEVPQVPEKREMGLKDIWKRLVSSYNKEKVPQVPKKRESKLKDLVTGIFKFYFDAEEMIRKAYNKKDPRIIEVCNMGVGTLEFNLSPKKKKMLIESGRKAAAKFLKDWPVERMGTTDIFEDNFLIRFDLRSTYPLGADFITFCAYLEPNIPLTYLDTWLKKRGWFNEERRLVEREKILNELVTKYKILSYSQETESLYIHQYWQRLIRAQRSERNLEDLQEHFFILGDMGERIYQEEGVSFQERESWRENLGLLNEFTKGRLYFGKNDLTVATCLNNMGRGLYAFGDYERSLTLHKVALETQRDLLGEKAEHPKVALSLYSIGRNLLALGRYEEALTYCIDSLGMMKNLFGKENYVVASILNAVGTCLGQLNKFKEAYEAYNTSYEMTKKSLGEEHPGVARILSNVGRALGALGRHDEALSLLNEAYDKLKKSLGKKEHPALALILEGLGVCSKLVGRYKKALGYFKKAFAIQKKLLGENHPCTEKSARRIRRLSARTSPTQASLAPAKVALSLR